MGMFSEIDASVRASTLEKILLEAIDSDDSVKEFTSKRLYKWYLSECSEGFKKTNPIIVNFFGKIVESNGRIYDSEMLKEAFLKYYDESNRSEIKSHKE